MKTSLVLFSTVLLGVRGVLYPYGTVKHYIQKHSISLTPLPNIRDVDPGCCNSPCTCLCIVKSDSSDDTETCCGQEDGTGYCCPPDSVCCGIADGCCSTDFPQCCDGTGACALQGGTCCTLSEGAGACPPDYPVCCPDICCLEGLLCCDEKDGGCCNDSASS